MAHLVDDVRDEDDVAPGGIERDVHDRPGRGRRPERVEVVGVLFVEIDHHRKLLAFLDTVRHVHDPLQRSAVVGLPAEEFRASPAVAGHLRIDGGDLRGGLEEVVREVEVVALAEVAFLVEDPVRAGGSRHVLVGDGVGEIFKSL